MFSFSPQHLTKDKVKLIEEDKKTFELTKDNSKLFYVFDSSYKVPKCYINIILQYQENPKFIKHIKKIEETFYKKYDGLLTDNQVSIDCDLTVKGVLIQIGGFTNTMKEIAILFMEFYFNSLDESRDTIVNELVRDDLLSKIFFSPYKKVFQGFYKAVLPGYDLPEETLSRLEDVLVPSNEDKKKFTLLLDVVGNISLDETLSIFDFILSYKISFERKNKDCNEIKDFVLDTNDTENNAVGVFYKACHPKDLFNNGLSRVYLQLVQERFFNELRTKEELGYIVQSNLITIPTTFDNPQVYLYFIVQSEREPCFLIERILKFVKEANNYIKALDNDTFNVYRECVIDELRERPKNLLEYSDFIHTLFSDGIKEINFKQLLIKTLEKINLEDIKDYNIFQSPVIIEARKKNTIHY